MALRCRNGNEVPWSRATPVQNFAVELDVHWHSIPNEHRVALLADCHANQPTKRNQIFERIKALERNVAKRPVHVILGWFEFEFNALPLALYDVKLGWFIQEMVR